MSEEAINGVAHVADRGLVLAASADSNVYMYTLDGGLVGIYGVHTWDIDNEATWQDPQAERATPVLDAEAQLLETAKAHREAQIGADRTRDLVM